MVTESKVEAIEIIKSLEGTMIGARRIHLAFARNKKKGSIKSQGGRVSTASPINAKRNKMTEQVKSQLGSPTLKPQKVVSNEECIDLSWNACLLAELEQSLVVETVNREMVDTVETLVEGLGFSNAQVKGLSPNKFLVSFGEGEVLAGEDLEFFKIDFADVRKATLDDLSVVHRSWVICRGLPMGAWTEDNFHKLLDKRGMILAYSPFIDESGSYQNPRILIESTLQAKIDHRLK